MNVSRFIISFLAVFAFIFGFEWIFHGNLLQPLYAQSPALWRPAPEMVGYFHWLVLGQAVEALMASLLFVKACRRGGLGAGLNFGLLVGLLFAGPALIQYAVAPLPVKLAAAWVIGSILKFAIAGLLLGAIYRPPKPAPPAAA